MLTILRTVNLAHTVPQYYVSGMTWLIEMNIACSARFSGQQNCRKTIRSGLESSQGARRIQISSLGGGVVAPLAER